MSRALTEIAPLLVEEAKVPVKEFGELVRDRKRRISMRYWRVMPPFPRFAESLLPSFHR